MESKKQEKAKKFKEDRENDKEATFKPVTLDYSAEINRPLHQLTHGDRCLDLYSRVKPGQYARKNIQEPDPDFEANKHELIFAPTINQFGCHLAKPDQSLDEIKGVKEKLTLMYKGRE